eukprot:12922577-Prorocentrum_lima.AAC.1
MKCNLQLRGRGEPKGMGGRTTSNILVSRSNMLRPKRGEGERRGGPSPTLRVSMATQTSRRSLPTGTPGLEAEVAPIQGLPPVA